MQYDLIAGGKLPQQYGYGIVFYIQHQCEQSLKGNYTVSDHQFQGIVILFTLNNF